MFVHYAWADQAGQMLAGAGHISGLVDIPNSGTTLWLPTEIFDFDINPGADGPSGGLNGGVDVPIAPDL